MIAIGTKAPDFNLFNQKRERVSLADHKGKKVVVAFFPAAFTSVCQKELCTFRDSLSALDGIGAAVLAISVDAPFANAAFAEKNQLNFPVLSDYARDATRAYGVSIDNFAGMPGYTASNRAVLVVNADGVITYAWVGPNPGVEPDYEEIKRAVAAA
jgi:peroxiredoxin